VTCSTIIRLGLGLGRAGVSKQNALSNRIYCCSIYRFVLYLQMVVYSYWRQYSHLSVMLLVQSVAIAIGDGDGCALLIETEQDWFSSSQRTQHISISILLL
jgi:hypothetical protein